MRGQGYVQKKKQKKVIYVPYATQIKSQFQSKYFFIY